jgi:hypothetical protein
VRFGPRVSELLDNIDDLLWEWAKNDKIRRIVFILAGEGRETGLFLQDGWLCAGEMESLVHMCRGTPALGILDFCGSTVFAEEVLEIGRVGLVEQPVFFLSSGRGVSCKTAVVLRGDARTAEEARGQSAIHSTIFHRSLFRVVARCPSALTLKDVPDLLNGDSAGGRCFSSVLSCSQSGAEMPSVRDFFGRPFDRASPLLGDEAADGFVDDVGRCLAEMGDDKRHLGRRFVRIAVSGGAVTVAERGVLAPDCAVLLRMKYGPSMKPKPVDTELPIPILVERLLWNAVGARPNPIPPTLTLSEEDAAMFERLAKFVRRGNRLPDKRALLPLMPYLSQLSWRKWCDRITDIRISPYLIVPRRGCRGVRRSTS